jgi:hypothetical protein
MSEGNKMNTSEIAAKRIVTAIGCSHFTAIRIAAELARTGVNAESVSMERLARAAYKVFMAMRRVHIKGA